MAEMTYGKQAIEARPVANPQNPAELMVLIQLPNGFVIVPPAGAIEVGQMIIETAQETLRIQQAANS